MAVSSHTYYSRIAVVVVVVAVVAVDIVAVLVVEEVTVVAVPKVSYQYIIVQNGWRQKNDVI